MCFNESQPFAAAQAGNCRVSVSGDGIAAHQVLQFTCQLGVAAGTRFNLFEFTQCCAAQPGGRTSPAIA